MSARDIAALHDGGFLKRNPFSSNSQPMPLETQMTLTLLQELLMALRANGADD